MKKSCMCLLLGVLCAGELLAGGEPGGGIYDHAIETYSKSITASCGHAGSCQVYRAGVFAERQRCVELLAVANNKCKMLKKVLSKKENRKIEKVLHVASIADGVLRGFDYCVHAGSVYHINGIDHINDDEKSFLAKYLCCCFHR